jgi:RNA recognition motif-containing protein
LEYSLWLEYIQYISNSLKIPDLLFSVAERASRNCPWVMEIWAEYFIVVEKHCPEKLLGVFERAILNFATMEQAGTIWVKYLESLRRLLRANGYEKAEVDKFSSNTLAAETHVLQLSAEPEPNEFVFTFNMMRLRLLASKANSIKEVREAWKNLLQRGYGYSFRNWLQYLLLESHFGDATNYRIQLSRAVAYIKDDLQSIANLWLNFERDEGDVSHLKICEKKISKFLQELSSVTEVDSRNGVQANHESRGGRKDFKKAPTKRKNIPEGKTAVEKKKRKGEDVPDGVVFKVPAIPVQTPAKEADKPKQQENRETPVTAPEKVQHDSTKDNRTVFVSNLDFSMGEDDIRSFFTDADVGDVEEIRLVKNFLGKSKGYAYVVFSSPESVPKALALDRKALSRRPVFVSRCDPDKATRPAGFKFPVKLEKNKLFVKGLASAVSEDTLRSLFSPYGSLKDVRLATHRNGFPKGHAYVDFEDSESAERAMKELDGKEVEGKVISVAISNPPPKGNRNVPSDMLILQRKPPTAFVPRSLQVHKTAPAEAENGPKKPMTNEDFKKFLKTK